MGSRLNDQLDDLSTNLSKMVEEMNKLTTKSSGDQLTLEGTDSLASITQILSAHVSSLGWINESTEELTTKVADLEQRIGSGTMGMSNMARRSHLGGSRRG